MSFRDGLEACTSALIASSTSIRCVASERVEWVMLTPGTGCEGCFGQRRISAGGCEGGKEVKKVAPHHVVVLSNVDRNFMIAKRSERDERLNNLLAGFAVTSTSTCEMSERWRMNVTHYNRQDTNRSLHLPPPLHLRRLLSRTILAQSLHTLTLSTSHCWCKKSRRERMDPFNDKI